MALSGFLWFLVVSCGFWWFLVVFGGFLWLFQHRCMRNNVLLNEVVKKIF